MSFVKKEGQLWFAAQFMLFCAMLISPFIGRFKSPLGLRALGLGISVGGLIVAVLGYRTLGTSHSPWINPMEGSHLVTTGIYRHLRHPIYAGWVLGGIGWALLTGSLFGVGVAVAGFIFYDLKSKEEERWLTQKYAEYAVYQSTVKRFVPWMY